jgi:16S rRNA processing protein RimM
LPEGRRFIADLVGLDVYDRRVQRVIGKLAEVVPKPAHDVYVVRDGSREVLIPAIDVFLRGVHEGRIEVETIDGMG